MAQLPPTAPTREHPRDRFRPSERAIDLTNVARDLRRGAPSSAGHRQVAVHRRGPVTVVLFAFEPGGELKQHRVEGLTCVHVLRGVLEVHTAAESHTLEAGQMLMLDPGVPHDMRSGIASDVLLTIHLDRGGRTIEPAH